MQNLPGIVVESVLLGTAMTYNWNGKEIKIRRGVISQLEKMIVDYRARWTALPPFILLGPNDFISLNIEFCELAKVDFLGLRKIEILGIPVIPKHTNTPELGLAVDLVPHAALGTMTTSPNLV